MSSFWSKPCSMYIYCSGHGYMIVQITKKGMLQINVLIAGDIHTNWKQLMHQHTKYIYVSVSPIQDHNDIHERN